MNQKETLDEAINNATEISLMTRLKWYGLNTLVLLLTIALLYWRTNLDILCPGVFVFFLGFCVLAVVQTCMKNKLLRLKTSFVLITVISTLFVGWMFYVTRPTKLFKEYVVDPVPPSVKIINSYYYEGIDPAIFLNFTMDSEDFLKILAAGNYELQNPSETQKELHEPMIPSWWNPGAFQKPRLYRIETGRPSAGNAEDNREVWLWVNQAGTEAYFAWLYF